MSNSLSICSTVSPIVVMILVDFLDRNLNSIKGLKEGLSIHPRAQYFVGGF